MPPTTSIWVTVHRVPRRESAVGYPFSVTKIFVNLHTLTHKNLHSFARPPYLIWDGELQTLGELRMHHTAN